MTDFATELRWAVDHMMRHKDGHPFLAPVTEAIAPGYFALVDEPMDLSTIKQKIPTYSTIKEFDEDVQLMFQNSLTYNTGGFMVTMTQRLKDFYLTEILPELQTRDTHRKRLSPNPCMRLDDFAPPSELADPDEMGEALAPDQFAETVSHIEEFPHQYEREETPEYENENRLEKLSQQPLKKTEDFVDYDDDDKPEDFDSMYQRKSNEWFQPETTSDFDRRSPIEFGLDQKFNEYSSEHKADEFALQGALSEEKSEPLGSGSYSFGEPKYDGFVKYDGFGNIA